MAVLEEFTSSFTEAAIAKAASIIFASALGGGHTPRDRLTLVSNSEDCPPIPSTKE